MWCLGSLRQLPCNTAGTIHHRVSYWGRKVTVNTSIICKLSNKYLFNTKQDLDIMVYLHYSNSHDIGLVYSSHPATAFFPRQAKSIFSDPEGIVSCDNLETFHNPRNTLKKKTDRELMKDKHRTEAEHRYPFFEKYICAASYHMVITLGFRIKEDRLCFCYLTSCSRLLYSPSVFSLMIMMSMFLWRVWTPGRDWQCITLANKSKLVLVWKHSRNNVSHSNKDKTQTALPRIWVSILNSYRRRLFLDLTDGGIVCLVSMLPVNEVE